MSTGTHIRRAANAPAPDEAEVRPSLAARRRARRELCAARVAAGSHVPGQVRSHYQRVDIAEAVHDDLAAMRAQMEAQRRISDREWAFREETDVAGPVALCEGVNVRVR